MSKTKTPSALKRTVTLKVTVSSNQARGLLISAALLATHCAPKEMQKRYAACTAHFDDVPISQIRQRDIESHIEDSVSNMDENLIPRDIAFDFVNRLLDAPIMQSIDASDWSSIIEDGELPAVLEDHFQHMKPSEAARYPELAQLFEFALLSSEQSLKEDLKREESRQRAEAKNVGRMIDLLQRAGYTVTRGDVQVRAGKNGKAEFGVPANHKVGAKKIAPFRK